jgi:hypothetical protein
VSYQDDLNSPEWKAKRREILIRDNLACLNCHNENLIKDCLVGLLTSKPNDVNGTLFNWIGFNSGEEPVRKNLFVKTDDQVLPLSLKRFYLAFIDSDFENEPFARLGGIRELKQINSGLMGDKIWADGYELPLTSVFLLDDGFKGKAGKLKGKVNESDKWMYIPGLHVHHTYYQINLKPREYPNQSLQTLCWICHENLHKNQSVPFLDKNGQEFRKLTPCFWCHGAGWFPQYKHIEQGICFYGRGAKYKELIEPIYEM